jgi:polysaccharide biosynthesis/export protein
MFRLNDEFSEGDLEKQLDQAERNYILQTNDWIQLTVYTNEGERIIDPNFEFGGGGRNNNQNNQNQQGGSGGVKYLIQVDGSVKLPVVGKKVLAGLTVDQAEAMLEQVFNEYYKDSFVKLLVQSRRVIVFNAGGAVVIPLENENMTLVEVLALSGGMRMGSKADKIRLVRGDLTKPLVYNIDLSTIAGMQQTIVDIESGDIIYIEPWRRPWQLAISDISPVFSVLSTFVGFYFLINGLVK